MTTLEPYPPDETLLAEEELPPDQTAHWQREHFIPLRKAELVDLLAESPALNPADRESFLQLCNLLEATLHFEYHQHLEQLKDLYSVFNPDRATRVVFECTDEQRDQQMPDLFDRFGELLERANYHRLSEAEIEHAVGAASEWGVRLDVEFEVFERLEVYARGDIMGRRTCRRWQKMYRREEVEVPIYERLIVIFRLKPHRRLDKAIDTDSVYIKLFKNIPKLDIDMLLPGTRFRMSLLDRGKILLPTLSGAAIAIMKIVKGTIVFAVAGIYGVVALVVGTVGYGLKSLFGYFQTKDKYQLNLTRSLYYQNLDNNAGVLFRVLDEAEEQEFREAILAYFLLATQAPPEGWQPRQIDRAAEEYLHDTIDVDVDFEVHDSLDKLRRLRLVEAQTDGRFRPVPLTETLHRLDHAWDAFFQFGDRT